jgi:hypothetical protein
MSSETGANVKIIFKNTLQHYNRVLEELKNDKEFDFSNIIIQKDIQQNIDKNTGIIDKLDSFDGLDTVDNNRKYLCDCLRGYVSYLETTKFNIATKLKDRLSLPTIDLSKLDNEIELTKKY